MKKEYVLDLSRENCHACHMPLTKDIPNQQEYCTHYACLIRNIKFTIPTVLKEAKHA